MAKPRSLKARTLLIIQALFKYADEDHRMSLSALNNYLQPYNLECDKHTFQRTVMTMKELGITVQSKGRWANHGVWIQNRPLQDHELSQLIFAVATNPNLSREQATRILRGLSGAVTIYEEKLLHSLIEESQSKDRDESLLDAYIALHKAIIAGSRVRYVVEQVKYNSETNIIEKQPSELMLFAPKCFYRADGELYVVGYNNTLDRVCAVNLKEICFIKPAYKKKDPKQDQIPQWIADIVPGDHVPEAVKRIVYEGPVSLLCDEQHIGDIYTRFGPPAEPSGKNANRKFHYTLQHATVTADDLHWLSQTPEYGIQIVGPEPLVDAVRAYYKKAADNMTNAIIPHCRKR